MKTFGSDPEFMVVDKAGLPKSAIGIVHGNIDNRINHKGHQFYHDNVLAECAIKPSASKEEAIENFRECLKLYTEMVAPYRLATIASATFKDSELRCDCKGEHNLCAKHAGCSPDFCAYRMDLVPPPKSAMESSGFRTCGGHIHLGGTELECLNDGPKKFQLVYALDLFLGVPSLFIDIATDRRNLYGEAGRYRDKDYGLEYRPLSNYWLSSPELVGLIFDMCKFVCEFVEEGRADEFYTFDLDKFIDTRDGLKSWTFNRYSRNKICQTINRSEKGSAEKFLEIVRECLPAPLNARLESYYNKPLPNFYESWGF